MKALPESRLVHFFLGIMLFFPPLSHAEPDAAKSFIGVGIGPEKLTYSEQITDIALFSSDTELKNWTLYLEAQKGWQNFFIGSRAYIPVSKDKSQETWTREGIFEQTNSLTYQWARADIHAGYFMHSMLNPYVGVAWGYSEQKRSNFNNINVPEVILETYTEKVAAFSALFGIQGSILLTARWSFSYYGEYRLPFYSNTTNTGLPGWEASDIRGYGYTLAARLHYSLTQSVTAALQMSGGKQHWDGSDWLPAGNSSAKWPENDTTYWGGFLLLSKNF